MDPRSVAYLQAFGRVAVGAAYIVAPGVATPAWIGGMGDRPATHVLGAAVGARDLALGAGVLATVAGGHGARPWLRAGAFADAMDLIATVRARDHLPGTAVAAVAAVAAGSVALGLWLLGELD